MAGVTPTGFVLQRLPETITRLRAEAVSLMQDLVAPGEIVDTSDSTTLGRLIGLATPSTVDLWEAAQEVYSAFDPNSATGIPLDNVVAYAGVEREEETAATAPVYLVGDTNTLIAAGSVVSSPFTGERFTLVVPVALSSSIASSVGVNTLVVSDSTLYTITYRNTTTTQNISYTSGVSATSDSILAGIKALVDASHPTLVATITGTSGSRTLTIKRVDVFQTVAFTVTPNLGVVKVGNVGEVQAENTGPLEQLVNTITEIATPVLGWDSVTNPTAASGGRLEETDEELRIRFRNSRFDRATNTLEAVYSGITGVAGVEDVTIYENDSGATDGNGVPGHSFLPIVVGGLSTDIANAIWDNRPIGITSFGNTTVSIADIQGFSHDISFSRPDGVVIYIEMDLTTNSEFPANGIDLLKSSLVEYFQNNFSVGDDVVYSRLYTPINAIPGHEVNSLTIGITPSPVGMVNIPIAFDEVASLNDLNITITV